MQLCSAIHDTKVDMLCGLKGLPKQVYDTCWRHFTRPQPRVAPSSMKSESSGISGIRPRGRRAVAFRATNRRLHRSISMIALKRCRCQLTKPALKAVGCGANKLCVVDGKGWRAWVCNVDHNRLPPWYCQCLVSSQLPFVANAHLRSCRHPPK